MRKPALLLSLLALAAASALAQQPPAPPPPVSERVEVRLVPVDVIVTDKKGNFITGLRREDFEIAEDGESVPITSFFEVADNTLVRRRMAREMAPPESTEPDATGDEDAGIPPDLSKRILLLFDTTGIDPGHRKRVVEGLRASLDAILVPGDRVVVAAATPSLQVLSEWTADRPALDAALAKLERIAGGNRFFGRRMVYEEVLSSRRSFQAMTSARAHASEERHNARRVLDSVDALLASQRDTPGKKSVLFVSGGLPLTAGLDVFYAVQSRFFTSGAFNEAQAYSLANDIEERARRWSTWGYTVNTVDPRGLEAARLDFGAQFRSPMFTSSTTASVAKSNVQDSLVRIAEVTGGQAILDTNDFAARIRGTAHFSGHYYALGYEPPHADDGKFHRIGVKLVNPEFRLAYRKGYQAPKRAN